MRNFLSVAKMASLVYERENCIATQRDHKLRAYIVELYESDGECNCCVYNYISVNTH